MEYKILKILSSEWGISERRIRQLIEEGRIQGATKVGKSWLIPNDVKKPRDTRLAVKPSKFVINLPDNLTGIDEKFALLNSKRPFPPATIKSIKSHELIEWTYNSNGIEGNTLTLKETKVVLEGITIGGKSVKEHLEAINHKEAILYLEELVGKNSVLSERDIKSIHQLVLKEIDQENAGRYRIEKVIISGATHIPPDHIFVSEQMEQLMLDIKIWTKQYHPLVVSALLHGEFVKIHPFVDGNGRTARLLMNFIAMKNGFPPLIIRKEQRLEYYDALDNAHITKDYTAFVQLIISAAEKSLDYYLSLV